MINHSVYQSNINNFLGNMSTLNGLINNKLSGLNVSKNCSIIGSNLKFVYNSFLDENLILIGRVFLFV